MKKLSLILVIYALTFISSCINPGNMTTVQQTIHSARGMAYSFSVNGVFPYLEEINKDKLGISITPDSVSDKILMAKQNFSSNQLYARQPKTHFESMNYIDSINIFTIYNFNEEFPASSNVNAISDPLNIMGDTHPVEDISKLKFFDQHFKFNQSATSDTLQFKITGRITGGEDFEIITNKLIVK